VSGLRERNKERRRQAILEAALDLLRSNDIESVTIEQIAALAGVSPPTIYNLVGTREQLLVALVDRISEQIVDSFSPPDGDVPDPVGLAKRAIDDTVAVFVADSNAYRQVVRALGELAVSGSKLSFDPSHFHVSAMRRAQELGLIRDDLEPVALGRQSLLTYVAAMNSWASGSLDDRGFVVAAQHGFATVLAAASSEAHRERHVAELARLGARFAQESGGPR
jgi:AcrR family transcriptional regulator